MRYILITCIVVLGALLSCKENDVEKEANPEVTIISPTNGSKVNGSSVMVTVDVEDFDVEMTTNLIGYILNNDSEKQFNSTSFEVKDLVFGENEIIIYLLDAAEQVKLADDTIIVIANFDFSVNVKGGTGSGSYAPGDKVIIESNGYEYPYIFSHWSGDNQVLADTTAFSALFDMPESNLTLESNNKVDPDYSINVIVNNGTGSGEYSPGDTVFINSIYTEPFSFTEWTGDIDLLEESAETAENYFIASIDDLSISANGIASNISFSEHLFPMITRECNDIGCHSAADTPAFTTYESIANSGENIVAKTQNGNMPPPLYSSLTEQEVELIRVWVEEGKQNN